MNEIIQIHEDVLEYLLQLRRTDVNLFFVPRKYNNQQRLEKGYWFLGNEKYLNLSFWNGEDWKERIHNISFIILRNGESYLELSAQDSLGKAKFLENVAVKIGGFEKHKSKNKWYKHYDGLDYIKNLDDFIKNNKSQIDDLVRQDDSYDILLLDKEFFDKYMSRVFELRRAQSNSVNKYGIYSDVFDKKNSKGTTQKNLDEKIVSVSGSYLRKARHNKIQQDIFNIFVQKYGKDNVEMEAYNRVDLVVKKGDASELIEVKPYDSVILCIREGLGQLFSYYYEYYLNTPNVSMTIIGSRKASPNEEKFIGIVQANLNVEFRYDSWENIVETQNS